MSAPQWSEARMAALISRRVFNRRCVLLVDRCTWTGHECDVLGITPCLRIIDVEIKISRADLRADAGKDKWWHRLDSRWDSAEQKYIQVPAVARDWPPRVWKHYYALPADIWKPELLDALPSQQSGVILFEVDAHDCLVPRVLRRATPNREACRLKPEQVVDIARLANLRMWDAYERVEVAQRDVGYWREKVCAVEEASTC